MTVRPFSAALLLALIAAPAFAQVPDSSPGPRPRAFRFSNRMPEMRMHLNRIPSMARMNVGEIRRRALANAMRTRRGFADGGLELRLRADARLRVLEDRSWQRRLEVQQRAMDRVHQQMNRMVIRQPLLRRRHFRDI